MFDHAWIDALRYRHEEILREAQQERLRRASHEAHSGGWRRAFYLLGRGWASFRRWARTGYSPTAQIDAG